MPSSPFSRVFRTDARDVPGLSGWPGARDRWKGLAHRAFPNGRRHCAAKEQAGLELGLHRAEEETAETIALLETLHSASPVGFGFIDRDLRLIWLNASLAAVNGTPVKDQLGRPVAEVVPELWPQLESIFRRVLDKGESVINQEVGGPTAADPGPVRDWLASYYPVRLDDEIIGVGIVAVDITERRRSDTFHAAVMDNMDEGLYALDAEGHVSFVNTSGAEMLGWTESELLGKAMHSVAHYQRADGSPNPESESELLNVRTRGRTIHITGDSFSRKDGSLLPVVYSASPLFDGSKIDGVVVVFRDATAERADQDRVQRELDALSWIGRVREALDEDRLGLYSQPIVPLRGGEPSEELLIRMIGRAGEIILPGSFISVAEKFGMISEIDRWVVGHAVRLAARGRRVNVNVSAQSIAPLYLLPMIERQLRETGADPAKLVFEITETALMQDVHAGEVFAEGLRDVGCGLSLDDFGTGYASFTYLKRLALQALKIDVDFVRGLTTNTANQHIVQSIVHLARGFDYETIAEGVEDDQTLALLREYGVDYAQGYLLGHPVPLEGPTTQSTRS